MQTAKPCEVKTLLFKVALFTPRSLRELVSAPLLVAHHVLSLFPRKHRYHCASGPAGHPDCDGRSRCLYLPPEAKVRR